MCAQRGAWSVGSLALAMCGGGRREEGTTWVQAKHHALRPAHGFGMHMSVQATPSALTSPTACVMPQLQLGPAHARVPTSPAAPPSPTSSVQISTGFARHLVRPRNKLPHNCRPSTATKHGPWAQARSTCTSPCRPTALSPCTLRRRGPTNASWSSCGWGAC